MSFEHQKNYNSKEHGYSFNDREYDHEWRKPASEQTQETDLSHKISYNLNELLENRNNEVKTQFRDVTNHHESNESHWRSPYNFISDSQNPKRKTDK